VVVDDQDARGGQHRYLDRDRRAARLARLDGERAVEQLDPLAHADQADAVAARRVRVEARGRRPRSRP
jgi:hypothetical protein